MAPGKFVLPEAPPDPPDLRHPDPPPVVPEEPARHPGLVGPGTTLTPWVVVKRPLSTVICVHRPLPALHCALGGADGAEPTCTLGYLFNSAPRKIRTFDPRFRRPMLYPD